MTIELRKHEKIIYNQTELAVLIRKDLKEHGIDIGRFSLNFVMLDGGKIECYAIANDTEKLHKSLINQ